MDNKEKIINIIDLRAKKTHGMKMRNTGLDFKENDQVRHFKFGMGRVVKVRERSDGDQDLRIDFQEFGMKMFIKSLAPIELVR